MTPPPKPKWTSADRARHKAVREQFAHGPTQAELEASGEYDGPIRSGAYFAVKILVHDLKAARLKAGLTLADVSKQTGMDQATLSRLENGRQANPTVDTLWRYAEAVGKRLVLTQGERPAAKSANGKQAAAKKRRQRAPA